MSGLHTKRRQIRTSKLFGKFAKDLVICGGIVHAKAIAIGEPTRENDFMDIDIEALTIVNAQKGDGEAWRCLFDWHFEGVYRYCVSVTHGRRDVAEEVAQQVFVIAARRINKFRSKRGTFRGWLLGMAKKRFMKLELKEARRKRYETQVSTGSPKGTDEGSQGLLVYEALAKLPVHYRMVLEAKYLEGLSVNEIAESQGRTEKATESLLSRAREKFGEVYKKMQERAV